MDQNDLQKLIEAIGILSEITLTFYRSVIAAGATEEEASTLLRAFIHTTFYRNRGS